MLDKNPAAGVQLFNVDNKVEQLPDDAAAAAPADGAADAHATARSAGSPCSCSAPAAV